MSVLNFRYRERRRTLRVALSVPVVVPGQSLLLVNENTSRSTETRVAHVRRERDGNLFVGLEFVNPDTNFWKMTFPVPGARPLRRSAGSSKATTA